MDIEDILKARQTGASVSTSKVDSPEAAVGRLKAKIRQQIIYWKNKEKIYQDIENVTKFNKSISDDQHKKTPEEIRDKSYVRFDNRYKKKFTLKDNNMIVGTHHMQHRRGPIYTPGKRVAIFLDHYNFLTRDDLS